MQATTSRCIARDKSRIEQSTRLLFDIVLAPKTRGSALIQIRKSRTGSLQRNECVKVTAIWDSWNASCTVTEAGRSFNTISMVVNEGIFESFKEKRGQFHRGRYHLLVSHYAAKPLECPHRSDSVRQWAPSTAYFGVRVCPGRSTPLLVIHYSLFLFRLSFFLGREWPAGGRFRVGGSNKMVQIM